MSGHLPQNTLSSYLDRELVADESLRVEQHLDDCLRCQRRLSGLRAVVAKLQRVGPAGLPAILTDQISHRISLESQPQSLLERLENRLERFDFPASTITLTFILVMALVVMIYVFVWAADRQHRVGTEIVPVPVSESVPEEPPDAPP